MDYVHHGYHVVDVAPFTGAWIEMKPVPASTASLRRSHPSRVRGLKCYSISRRRRVRASHPSRVRGLKLSMYMEKQTQYFSSHPSRVRGLKYKSIANNMDISEVAPFTGAWIEMLGTYKHLEK